MVLFLLKNPVTTDKTPSVQHEFILTPPLFDDDEVFVTEKLVIPVKFACRGYWSIQTTADLASGSPSHIDTPNYISKRTKTSTSGDDEVLLNEKSHHN